LGLWIALIAAIPTPVLAEEAAKTVRLTIDYGDGVEKTFSSLPWKEKMTVFDALQAAEKHPRGIRLSHTGSGEKTFITALDGLENQGADGANWRYEVNGQRGDVSAAVARLNAADKVVWRFSK